MGMLTEADVIDNIRLLRKERDMTQAHLAIAAAINVKRYNRIEKQRRGLKVGELMRIAAAMRIETEFILSQKLKVAGGK